MNDRRTSQPCRPPYRFAWLSDFALALLLAGCVVATIIVFFKFPYTYGKLISEDNFGESVSFVAFALASFCFLYMAAKPIPEIGRFWLAVLTLGCAFVALEEVSWGQRFLGIPTPDAIRQLNAQGELNLHNLDDNAMWSIFGFVVIASLLFGAVVPAVRRRVPAVQRLLLRLKLPIPPLYLAPLFIAPFYFWFLSGFARPDELVELFLALAMVTYAADLLFQRRHKTGLRRLRPAVVASAVVICSAGGMALSGATTPPKSLEHTLLTNATNLLPENGFFDQADRLFEQLEAYSDETSVPSILHAKADYLAEYGRAGEAMKEYARIREHEKGRLQEDPDNLDVLVRLFEVSTSTGDSAAAQRYRTRIEQRVREEMGRADTAIASKSSRPEWTHRVWSDDRRIEDRKSRLLIMLGDVHAHSGDYVGALEGYIEARQYATWGNTKRFLADRYIAIANNCLRRDRIDPDDRASAHNLIDERVNVCRRTEDERDVP